MRSILIAVLALVLASTARAQTLIYGTQFDDATGWTLDPQLYEPWWAVDALPASTPFGAFRSAPSSLNFNDDVDYNLAIEVQWTAAAHAPSIALGNATGIPVMTFWCNNQSQEGVCQSYEQCDVRVRSLGVLKTSECLHWFEPGATCQVAAGYPGWHRHALVLDRSWNTIQTQFEVNYDAIDNGTEGWFIDDFEVRDWPAPSTYCTAKVNSLGCTPRIAFTGVPSLDPGESFAITASQVLNNKLGVFFYGLNGRAASPFQGGTLCVAAPFRRTPASTSGGHPPPNDCSGQLSFDLLAWQATGNDPGLVEGAQVNGQFWCRDGGASFGVGLTDAIELTLIP